MKFSKRDFGFANFIKCLTEGFRNSRKPSIFFAFSEGYPLPAKKDIPKLCAMKMNEAIRFNRWWWGSRT
jgi:hypothetical protein